MEKVFLTELGSWEVDKDALLLRLWNRQRLSCWVVNKRSQALVGDEAEELGWRQEEKVDGLGACESQPRTKGQAEQEGNPCPVFCINLASYCSREIFYCFLFSPSSPLSPKSSFIGAVLLIRLFRTWDLSNFTFLMGRMLCFKRHVILLGFQSLLPGHICIGQELRFWPPGQAWFVLWVEASIQISHFQLLFVGCGLEKRN